MLNESSLKTLAFSIYLFIYLFILCFISDKNNLKFTNKSKMIYKLKIKFYMKY